MSIITSYQNIPFFLCAHNLRVETMAEIDFRTSTSFSSFNDYYFYLGNDIEVKKCSSARIIRHRSSTVAQLCITVIKICLQHRSVTLVY